MVSDLVLAAAPVVKMEVSSGSWLGNVGSGFLAFLFCGVSYWLAKNNHGPWGPWVAGKLGKISWDWKSLMTAVFGFLGVTAALGSTGWMAGIAQWAQGIFTWPIVQDLFSWVGMSGICVAILIKIWLKKDDNIHDLIWGGVAALALPLGGGFWTQTSLAAGNFLVNLLNGIPNG